MAKPDTVSREGSGKLAACRTMLALAPISLVIWIAQQTGLGWDGLFIWEFKARVIFLNGGALLREI